MKKHAFGLLLCIACLNSATLAAIAQSHGAWVTRLELGGNIPDNPSINLFDGPVTGGTELDLDAGVQFNLAAGYQFNPYFRLEGELGFGYNEVNQVGNWTYPDSSLSQFSMMANVVFELPMDRMVPYAGVGIGGVLSTVSFGSYYYYYYSSSAGYGNDYVLAGQVFAGIRFRLSDSSSLGLAYHCVVTDELKWKVQWWTGDDFYIGVDSMLTHQITLSYSIGF
jgi:opacity protein-like surface antigen